MVLIFHYDLLQAIPPTLGGVVLAAVAAKVFKWPVKTLADIAGAEVSCYANPF